MIHIFGIGLLWIHYTVMWNVMFVVYLLERALVIEPVTNYLRNGLQTKKSTHF